MELDKGVNTCLLEAFMREVVFEVSIEEWVGIPWEQERHPRWMNRLSQVTELGKYKAFLEWHDGWFGWGRVYVQGVSVGG